MTMINIARSQARWPKPPSDIASESAMSRLPASSIQHCYRPPLSPSRTEPDNEPRRRPAISLRLEPNEHLSPNYFYVGVLAGERLKRATEPKPPQRRKSKGLPRAEAAS